jgi:hypothetical protein
MRHYSERDRHAANAVHLSDVPMAGNGDAPEPPLSFSGGRESVRLTLLLAGQSNGCTEMTMADGKGVGCV